MKSRICLICCFLCLHMLFCRAQNISFHHLTTDDGLSHNSVISIYQDERGLMWFGTRNGVSLYNGKDFKIYQKEKNNPNSILYNDIYHITGDKRGHVYVMTNRGISAYDMEKDRHGEPDIQVRRGEVRPLPPDALQQRLHTTTLRRQ